MLKTANSVPSDADDFRIKPNASGKRNECSLYSYLGEGFPDWSRRDLQQLVRALEAYVW